MDDIGNIVYVLLIILFGLFQLFASKKKKQEQKGGGETKSPFDDIFGDAKEDQQREARETSRETPEKRVAEGRDEYQPSHDFEDPRGEMQSEKEVVKENSGNEYMEYLKDRKDDMGESELDTEVETPELEVISDKKKKNKFDLKKAVIYSTILERKFKI